MDSLYLHDDHFTIFSHQITRERQLDAHEQKGHYLIISPLQSYGQVVSHLGPDKYKSQYS